MEKIVRVTQPDLKIFVAESITGNDATEQAKSFNEIANIDGTILTKADVDEKGGTAISIGYVTSKPILYLGTGQEYKDLTLFDPKEIIVNLGLDWNLVQQTVIQIAVTSFLQDSIKNKIIRILELR